MSAVRRNRRSWRPVYTGAPPTPPAGKGAAALLSAVLDQLGRLDSWWASSDLLEAERWTDELEDRYHRLYEMSDWDGDDVRYEEAQVAYRVGRLAAKHPEHGTGPFERVAAELEKGWGGGESFRRVRRYVELGFRRRRFSAELLRIRDRVGELEKRLRDAP